MTTKGRRAMPSQAELLSVLRYEPETGAIFWRERDVSFFNNGKYSADRRAKGWNKTYAGKPALNDMDAPLSTARA